MDWQALRESAWKWNNAGDDAAGDLCRFIPADPNKAADAEWLKERGWVNTGNGCFAFKDGDLLFDADSIHQPWLLFGVRVVDINPTRMTVALFEAAAMEAMKHG